MHSYLLSSAVEKSLFMDYGHTNNVTRTVISARISWSFLTVASILTGNPRIISDAHFVKLVDDMLLASSSRRSILALETMLDPSVANTVMNDKALTAEDS